MNEEIVVSTILHSNVNLIQREAISSQLFDVIDRSFLFLHKEPHQVMVN